MLIDLINSKTTKSFGGVLPERTVKISNNDLVALTFWGEHCVECGAPACYSSCDKYRRNPSGSCRRFRHGFEILKLHDGRRFFQVEFDSWGKLELAFQGHVGTRRAASLIRKLDLIGVFFARLINRFVPFLNRYSYLRHRLIGACFKSTVRPEYWVMQFYVEKPVDLIAAVFAMDVGDLMSEHIKVGPGWHTYEFNVPKTSGLVFFRLSAINGTDCPVVFSELTVGAHAKRVERSKYVKCVAWDLDNTLWDGILVEDGPTGIHLRQQVVDVIKELDSRGIVSTICSKNDYDAAWKQLERFGIAEYFVFPRINWMPKSKNIESIAKEMNIGIDAFAFIDDSPNERGEVAEHLPMVRVFADNAVNSILDREEFTPPVSSESSNRRKTYLVEMERRGSEDSFGGDRLAFLRSCELKLKLVSPCDPDVKRRCWELVNRTNQLTLAARRYTEASFGVLMENNDCWAIKCWDRYGDYGIVGFLAAKAKGGAVEVNEFVMSCRVAKKYCEFAAVNWLARKYAAEACNVLFAIVTPTGRNNALISAFDEMPGIRKNDLKEKIEYSLQLSTQTEVPLPVEVVS